MTTSPGAGTPVLRTERLVLRGWEPADRAPFAAMNADPVVMEFFPALMTREQSDAFADRQGVAWAERGYGLWALDVDGAFAGFVGLALADFASPFTPAVEVGWRLAAPFWGRGLATEAAELALEHGFSVLGLSEIVSFTALLNARSWAVMERLGMVRDIEFEHPRVPAGHPVRPHVLYRLTVQKWAADHGRAIPASGVG